MITVRSREWDRPRVISSLSIAKLSTRTTNKGYASQHNPNQKGTCKDAHITRLSCLNICEAVGLYSRTSTLYIWPDCLESIDDWVSRPPSWCGKKTCTAFLCTRPIAFKSENPTTYLCKMSIVVGVWRIQEEKSQISIIIIIIVMKVYRCKYTM